MKVFLALLLLLAAPALADVYKKVMPDGEVIYSDLRSEGAQRMNAPNLPTYTPPPLPQFIPPQREEVKALYESFVIDTPLNDTTIRDNLGNVELLVTLEPGLIAKNGHRIEYYLDGESHGRRSVDTRKIYTALDRGEHQLSAAVVDKNGKTIISTKPVTVYLQKVSKLN